MNSIISATNEWRQSLEIMTRQGNLDLAKEAHETLKGHVASGMMHQGQRVTVEQLARVLLKKARSEMDALGAMLWAAVLALEFGLLPDGQTMQEVDALFVAAGK